MGREDWKRSIRVRCERMECKESVVMKIGDVMVVIELLGFVSLLAGFDVEAIDNRVGKLLVGGRRKREAGGGK